VIGAKLTEAELLKIGERLWNLERAILVREGRRRDTDALPDYLFTLTNLLGSPPVDKKKFEGLKDTYYTLRGWNPSTGIPTRAKLEELGLKDVADELKSRGISL